MLPLRCSLILYFSVDGLGNLTVPLPVSVLLEARPPAGGSLL